MDKKKLLKFIAKAHRNTYAAPKEIRQLHRCQVPILEGHKDYKFSDGDFSYHDSYTGSVWAPGREVVFFQSKPIWCMAYQGKDNSNYSAEFYDTQGFPFLKKALMNFEDSMPFRGPKQFIENDFKYTFKMKGDYDYFTAQEKIFYKGEVIFLQDVMGELVR